jgi:hypothetical protein
MEDDSNSLLFSAVTIWEIRMKQALGKLDHADGVDALYEPDLVTFLRSPRPRRRCPSTTAIPSTAC